MNLGMRSSLAGLLALGSAIVVGPSFAAEGDFDAQRAPFAYPAEAPFDVKEVGKEKREGAMVHDIVFVANPGSLAAQKAYFVVPEGKGPFAGILWVHWLGEPTTTNRTQYLGEAVALAGRGAVSLLVDAMWSTPEWYGKRVPEQDYENSIRQVIALRRAMDLLTSRPDVDKTRVGYVGHDYGGMYGMLAAGLDRRAKTYVYVAVASSLNDWAFFARQPKSKTEYLRQNAPLELTDFLRQVKNASTLYQFAKSDDYVTRADTAVVMGATADPKERRFYDTDHGMGIPKVAEDRQAWLVKELKLAGGQATP